jgi:hypothetical protein
MQATQNITINVLNTPGVPGTGANPGGLPAKVTGAIAGSPILAAAAVLFAVLLALALASVLKRRKTTAKVLFALLLLPGLAMVFALAGNASATSSLQLASDNINIDVYKDDTVAGNAIKKTVASTTIVTTDNATGYTMSAKLQGAPDDGITAALDDEVLATTDIEIYVDDTGQSPSTHSHNLAVTIPADISVGDYSLSVDYSITENPPIIMPMQAFTASDCQALTIYDKTKPGTDPDNQASTVTLKDTRNNQKYTIRRLQDGKCWMIDNLKLELGVANQTNPTLDTTVLEPENTNVSTSTPIDFGWGDFTLEEAAHAGNFTTGGYLSRWGTAAQISPNYDAWRQVDPGGNPYCNGTIADNVPGSGIKITETGSETNCGYLYNFYTATAGSASHAGYGTPPNVSGYLAPESICPAGWRLPKGSYSYGDEDNDLPMLNAKMDNPSAVTGSLYYGLYTNWLPTGSFRGSLSGVWNKGLYDQGSEGDFWTTNIASDLHSRSLVFYSGEVGPGNMSAFRFDGFGVRCVAGS